MGLVIAGTSILKNKKLARMVSTTVFATALDLFLCAFLPCIFVLLRVPVLFFFSSEDVGTSGSSFLGSPTVERISSVISTCGVYAALTDVLRAKDDFRTIVLVLSVLSSSSSLKISSP
eukprot:NODE_314_length_11212_cov_0.272924.p9 type:complete len:118 gc:universal NODE_314_length_11212_cov_0.272924:2991-3344(+)